MNLYSQYIFRSLHVIQFSVIDWFDFLISDSDNSYILYIKTLLLQQKIWK